MRVLLQRVSSAKVKTNGEVVGSISRGLLVYLGVSPADNAELATGLAEKVAALRIFEDSDGKLNLSVRDVRGGVLAVPNFTLMADARKGRRPSFDTAAGAEHARPIYDAFLAALADQGCQLACGAFGEHMEIESTADGPVNIVIDFPPETAPPVA